jgi:VanZ family protein
MRRRVLFVLVCVWMGVIFSLSSQEGYRSHQTSRAVVEKLQSHVPARVRLVELDGNKANVYVRKGGHFLEYAALAMLVYLLMRSFNISHRGLLTLLVCLIFAVFDEVNQAFTPDRTSSGYDVLIDSAGAVTVIIGLYILELILRGITNEG